MKFGESYRFGADYIDLRDVLKHRAELLRDNPEDVEHWDEDDQEFLAILADFEDQLWTNLKDYAQNEPTLILDTHFTDYAISFASDVEGISEDSPIHHYVDWERYADDLKEGWSEYQLGRFTYYGRDY